MDKLLVDRIAKVLGGELPAAALLTMPGTVQIYAIAAAIAEEIQHKQSEQI